MLEEAAARSSVVPIPRRTLLRWSAVVLLWLGCVHAADAATPGERISGFAQTVWTEKDGVPPKTFAIAQTEDGWLWFGGPSGLYQFDGVQFQEVRADDSAGRRRFPVSVLYAVPSGELVIGMVGGGISVYRNGTFTHYDDERTLAAGRVHDFARDLDGTLWAICEVALLRFDGNRWLPVGGDWNLPETSGAFDLAVDRRGTLWIAVGKRIWKLPRGARKFVVTDIAVEWPPNFIQSPDGLTWILHRHSADVLPDQEPGAPDPVEASRMSNSELFDSRGRFWSYVSDRDGFPYRRVEGIDSLATHLTTALEDRQGNIWFASNDGKVHRFRRPSLVKVSAEGLEPDTAPAAIVPDADQNVWFALKASIGPAFGSEGLWVFDTKLHRLHREAPPPGGAIARESEGTLWYAAGGALWRLTTGRFERAFPLPEGAASAPVSALAARCAGGLWVAYPRQGLWRHDGLVWRRDGDIAGLPEDAPTRQVCDFQGRLWLGYQNGTVLRIEGGKVTRMGAEDGLQVGRVSDISVGRNVLVAGERGLAVLLAGRFFTLNAAHSLALDGVTGIAESPTGDVWLNAAGGMGQIRVDDIPRSAAAATTPLPVRLYDTSDGYPSPGYTRPDHSPNIALDAGGRVWTSGLGGIAYLDTAAALPARTPSPAIIRAVHADGEVHRTTDFLDLAKGTRNLRFDYTAVDYTHPERLRFRYRLEGIDTGWVDDQGRRQAVYANMGPGTYRFVVNASDETGAWVTTPTSMTITIAPTFVQSWYFMALCLFATVALAMGAHLLRLRQVAARQERLLDERLNERERIARDLHDTLLQGTQALIIKIHALSRQMPSDGPLRQQLSDTLQVAQRTMDEGRDRIQALREAPGSGEDVATSLAAVGTELVHGTGIAFSAVVDGAAQQLRASVAEAAHLIGQEALRNAVHHAGPAVVELQVVYADDGFRLRVRDDGSGIEETKLLAGAPRRHWGLSGMRERAREVGGELAIWTREGAGTEVELWVPERAAYPVLAARRWWSRLLGRPAFADKSPDCTSSS